MFVVRSDGRVVEFSERKLCVRGKQFSGGLWSLIPVEGDVEEGAREKKESVEVD